MDNNSPLYIPPSKRIRGLKIHCYACGTTVDSVCKKLGVDIKYCKSGSDHVFKVFAHVPGTSNGRRTKSLTGVRDLNEARRLALEFQQEVKDEANSVPSEQTSPSKIEITKPHVATGNLTELMSRYIGYLHGDPEIVPAYKRKKRSPETLKEMERTFLRFVTAAKENGRDIANLTVDGITEEMIGEFYEYLTEELELGNAGYNRAITNMVSFYNYLIDEKLAARNPFAAITRKPIREYVDTIAEHQFNALKEILQKPELGMHQLRPGIRRSFYRPWMRDAVELGLYTGRRREEILRMKWKDVSDDVLRVPDYKVIRQKGLTNEKDWIYRVVPLTRELRTVLERLSQEGTDPEAFVLAPKETMDRDSMRIFMSKSFAHYYAQLGYAKRLKFGCLRKTYISGLAAAIGLENAQAISGHSKTDVMKKHYTDKKVLAKAAKEFSVYQSESESEEETESKQQQKNGRRKDRDAGLSR